MEMDAESDADLVQHIAEARLMLAQKLFDEGAYEDAVVAFGAVLEFVRRLARRGLEGAQRGLDIGTARQRAIAAAEEGVPPTPPSCTPPLEIPPDDAHRRIDAMKLNARGNIALPTLLAELGGWGEQLHAFEAGQACADGWWVTLPQRQERVWVARPWQPPCGGDALVVVDNSEGWGEAWQRLGAAEPQDALAFLGCFMREVCGKPLSLVSTKYLSPAKQWAEMVKREEEARHGAPCFNPNEDNINLAQLEGEDQALRDGRWLLVFKWCAKVAAFTGGRMIQLKIPGFGLSPMQLAEEQIADECGLFVEKRVLDKATGAKLTRTVRADIDPADLDPAALPAWSEEQRAGRAKPPADWPPGLLPADFDLAPMLREGGSQEAKLKGLVAQLSGGDAAAAEQATEALGVLAIEAANKVAIMQVGALGPLIALLSEGSAGAREQAAGALANLALNDENQVAIVRAGALTPLIALLSEGSAGAQEKAVEALDNLAFNAENKVAIVQAGALGPLIALLSEGSEGAREQAASALWNLADNALGPLIALLSEGSAGAREQAAGALDNLADNADNEVAIVQAGALGPLIALLSEGSAGAREQAASALWNLADNAENKVVIAREGALVPLIALLSEGSEGAREKAAAALANLAANAENKVAIVQAGALAPLIALLSEGSAGAREQAAAALANLAANAENKVAIVQAGALVPLIAMLGEGSAGAREEAAGALRNLAANNAENKVAIGRAGALGPLIALLGEGSAGVRKMAARVLKVLTSDASNRVEAAKLGYVRPSR
jgi:vacuolar protein 8